MATLLFVVALPCARSSTCEMFKRSASCSGHVGPLLKRPLGQRSDLLKVRRIRGPRLVRQEVGAVALRQSRDVRYPQANRQTRRPPSSSPRQAPRQTARRARSRPTAKRGARRTSGRMVARDALLAIQNSLYGGTAYARKAVHHRAHDRHREYLAHARHLPQKVEDHREEVAA